MLALLSTARTLRVTATAKVVAPAVLAAVKAPADVAAALAAAAVTNPKLLNQKDRLEACPFLFLLSTAQERDQCSKCAHEA